MAVEKITVLKCKCERCGHQNAKAHTGMYQEKICKLFIVEFV